MQVPNSHDLSVIQKLEGSAALLTVAAGYAAFGIIVRVLGPEFGDFHQLWIRSLAAALLCSLIPASRVSWSLICSIPGREWRVLVLRSVAIYSLGALLWIAAIRSAPLGTVAFISALPLEGLWGRIFYKQHIPTLSWGWILLSIVGLYFVCDPRGGGFGGGEVMAFLSALTFSLGISARRSHTGCLGNGQITTLICFMGALQVAALGFFSGSPFPLEASRGHWVLAIGAGALIAANFWCLNRGFQLLSSSAGGGLLMLECVFSPILGYLYFQEYLSNQVLLGGACILLSTLGLLLAPGKHPPVHAGRALSSE